jgi:hypothetical protein
MYRMWRFVFLVWLVATCASSALCQQGTPGIGVAKISLPGPAYIGMPIWMKVESPDGYRIHYPSSTSPSDFYCNQVEMKRDGQLLAPRIDLSVSRNGGACGWLGVANIADSKLPIHLQYPLTEPGTYLVRFTRREYQPGRGMQTAEQSHWVPLVVRTAPPGVLERWLRSELAMVQGASPGQLLGEVLPSLLASHDPRVLRAMIDTSYDGNPVVTQYAANSLRLFDAEAVRIQLLAVVGQRGPNDALGWFFSSDADLVRPIAPQIVQASLPYVRSREASEVEAAVHVLMNLRDPHFGLSAASVARIEGALRGDIPFIIAQRNDKAAWWIANFLGETRPASGREELWELVGAGLAKEQSLSCITWFRDPADLSRLASIAEQYDSSDPYGYKHSGFVEELGTEYGTVARPYLRDILASSKQTWVRTEAAKALVLMDDRAGWEFFAGVLKQRPFYRDEMARWLRDSFPAIRDADDVGILHFVESRATRATAE